MLLGEASNENDVELSECEIIALGLDLCVVVISNVFDNVMLRNETRSLLIKVNVKYGATSHNYNKSKVIKSMRQLLQCIILRRRALLKNELGWMMNLKKKKWTMPPRRRLRLN